MNFLVSNSMHGLQVCSETVGRAVFVAFRLRVRKGLFLSYMNVLLALERP